MIDKYLNKIAKDKLFKENFQTDSKLEFSILGQGEYNKNYLFYSPRHGQKLVLRVATASQMNLSEQITYEFRALKLLEQSRVTPKVYYLDDRKELMPFGFLVMDYLPGRPLNYKRDLEIAAEILAAVHNLKVPAKNNPLIVPNQPIQAIFKECQAMFSVYEKSRLAKEKTLELIKSLLAIGENIPNIDLGYRTIINTELNSANFLINKDFSDSYLIDWEKPLYGYPAQDLGHFLAPTTTFFRSDHILSNKEIKNFLHVYCQHSQQYEDLDQLWQSIKNYLAINCLRGITWSAMAYVQYNEASKLIQNDYTYKKITDFLQADFLKMLKDDYLNDFEK